MLVTTTSTLDGKRITKYLGLVSGEAILGANIFRDLFAGIRDIVGGRSAAYEQELRRAKDIAVQEMLEQAKGLGANAVVGVDLDYETVGQSGGMLMVSASGTAVVDRGGLAAEQRLAAEAASGAGRSSRGRRPGAESRARRRVRRRGGRRAAPASVAALTAATSPRTIAVTSPASTFCQPTNTTFAVFTIASAASIMPTSPRVSTMPSASPMSEFS